MINNMEIDTNTLKNTKKGFPVRISGNSMYPTFKEGDIVYVKAMPYYNIDDIVVVNEIDSKFIHRILKIRYKGKEKYYLTKGDNNTFLDRWYREKNIIGKVVC